MSGRESRGTNFEEPVTMQVERTPPPQKPLHKYRGADESVEADNGGDATPTGVIYRPLGASWCRCRFNERS
ncbi:hypothetical protein EYF80_026602 [Liparis tanakae]|uniref:Uncharacterized protein n=1 Tax=Liparis tanakae TaxID=230148 RepID=A0A4Z2HB90_9TELE|nr:hypothetical protein EYF80_026602 [Liparis tanakae]